MDIKLENQIRIMGNNLSEARRMQGLTMQDVAEKAGLCRQTVSAAEAGNSRLQIGEYLKIADALGVEMTAELPSYAALRASRHVDPVHNCTGVTRDGTEFVVKARRDGYHAEFYFSGVRQDAPLTGIRSGAHSGTFAKTVFLFSASQAVMRRKAELLLQEKAEEITGRNSKEA